MSAILSNDMLAEQAARFAESVGPCDKRWAYCFDRATYWYTNRHGYTSLIINERSVPTCERITGSSKGGGAIRLRKIRSVGLDEALKYRSRVSGKELLTVGLMQAWHVGHVYFARLAEHPHIIKIGFSRRVRDRLEDVEARAKAKLLLPGTLLDEQWWHKRYDKYRISGEWFFDPATDDRSVPAFLSASEKRAA